MYDDIIRRLVPKRDNLAIPFDRLMPRKVRNILLVSSYYDSFTFKEDGQLSEALFSDYLELNLRNAPHLEKAANVHEALERLRTERYDMVISMLRIGDMRPQDFGRQARAIQPGLPIVLLTFSQKELAILENEDLENIDRVFMWRGDVRLFLAIVKYAEDRMNAWHDARAAGVQCLILVEDSVRFYSSYLPMLYTEIMMQTRSLMTEGANRMQQLLRMHARPKVLLANTYEEALVHYNQYQDHLLGVIVDARFPRGGVQDPEAGRILSEQILEEHPDAALLIQSSDPDNELVAKRLGATFIYKRSPSLLHELRSFMQTQLGFGDFVFRRPDGSTVTTAGDLKSLTEAIKIIPEECLLHHGRRKDFSTWLMARTEFALSKAIRMRKMTSFDSPKGFRKHLIDSLKVHRSKSRAGIISDFSPETFEADSPFIRIGKGSLGGKGRGLAFFNSLLLTYDIENNIPGLRIFMPNTAVIATAIFDQIMESEKLTELVLGEPSNEKLDEAFLALRLPEEIRDALRTFLSRVKYPLAVRSSSLLEDASYQPFAGIYKTYMIPNNSESLDERLNDLVTAIKLVYASTFYAEARDYLRTTPNRLEEEKMAVVIQEVVGRRHGEYLYPDVAGVARSHNYYPIGDMAPADGVACAVLGMGRAVVEGGRCMRFSPADPQGIFNTLGPRDFVSSAQREFWALYVGKVDEGDPDEAPVKPDLVSLELDVAMEHGTLAKVGSVYTPRDRGLVHGIDQPGLKLVTLAGVINDPDIRVGEGLRFLLELGQASFSWPVEIEFALNLNEEGGPHELGFLQIRPMTVSTSGDIVQSISPKDAVCTSAQAVGPGQIEPVRDLVYVRPDTFSRAVTNDIAEEVGAVNATLRKEERRYVLIGPGRWGSTDWRLGIPVTWGQISNVSCLVETPLEGLKVNPSQGSHFFHNITSFGIGCLAISGDDDSAALDEEWLLAQQPITETEHVRHLRFDQPMRVLVDGHSGIGVVLKPGAAGTVPRTTNMP